MNRHTTTRRYYLVIEKIAKDKRPSFNQIKDYLYNHGFEVSKRTVQRDIEQIRLNFGIEINYNRAIDGYSIDETNSTDLHSFLKFLDMVNTADLLLDSLEKSKEMMELVHFSSDSTLFTGHHLLHQIMQAIRNKQVIEFIHINYEHNTEKEYILEPYLLKEYQNRWYVVGQVSGKEKMIRTFGLDRVLDLKVLTQTFKLRWPREELRKEFDNVVGLTYNADKIVELVLRSTRFNANYLKSLPLHHSQEIIKEQDSFVYFKYKLKPNHELIQRILSMACEVVVEEPEDLKKQIIARLQTAIKQYS